MDDIKRNDAVSAIQVSIGIGGDSKFDTGVDKGLKLAIAAINAVPVQAKTSANKTIEEAFKSGWHAGQHTLANKCFDVEAAWANFEKTLTVESQ